ncbi:MAG TPA: PIN domain-containing protein [Candidatus Bathyarchaeia archaeon]|nr:PIN domain-containing protein [Candidatus Bathyarchaeia archaeon]
MKILVDVNVFVDVQRRRANWNTSYLILKTVLDGKNEGFISALTPAILYFLRREITSETKARTETSDAIERFTVVDLTAELIEDAFSDERLEFEDAIQFHSAKQCDSIMITRNKKDFKSVAQEVEILAPEEFLRKYAG